MLLKIWVTGVFLSLTSVAMADDLTRFQHLKAAVQAECSVPDSLHRLSEPHYERFLAQVLLPELKMLNTAFVTGFSAHISRYAPIANCVVVFMGLPNNPQWERDFSFFERARRMGSLPTQQFAGFDENDQVIFKALESLN